LQRLYQLLKHGAGHEQRIAFFIYAIVRDATTRTPIQAWHLPIGQSWRRNWSRLTPFFDYPPEIRKVIYTTNAIESVNMGLRKLSKNRGSFPSDEALTQLFYLALRNISQK